MAIAIPQISTNFLALIPERIAQIGKLIMSEPLVYFPLIGIWFIFELYYFVSSSDSDIKESDLLENSISSIYVAIMISPIVTDAGKFSFESFTNPSPRTILSIALFAYAGLLMLFAFTKMLPMFLVHILGGASIDTFFTMLALIWVDGSMPLDLATISVIIIPILIMHILKLFRRLSRGY